MRRVFGHLEIREPLPMADIPRPGTHLELDTRSCCGCGRVFIRNPDRTRPMNYCRKCDSYLCDDCALAFKVSGEHKPFAQIADEYRKTGT